MYCEDVCCDNSNGEENIIIYGNRCLMIYFIDIVFKYIFLIFICKGKLIKKWKNWKMNVYLYFKLLNRNRKNYEDNFIFCFEFVVFFICVGCLCIRVCL